MSNFRRLLQSSQQEPSYTELEYIECTGTQYIDTGIVANSDTTSFELDYNLLAKSETYNYGIVGARVSTNEGRLYAISHKSSASDSYWGTGTTSYLLPTDTSTIVGDNILTYNRLASKTYYLNSTSITNITKSFSTGTTLSLGAIHRQSDNSYMYPAVGLRIKRFRLWENDVAIMDCIPVLNQNGVPCLYNRIAKNFLFNSGTGVFAYKTLTKLTYIESSGTQYIDTKIPANIATINIDFCYTAFSSSSGIYPSIFGARTTATSNDRFQAINDANSSGLAIGYGTVSSSFVTSTVNTNYNVIIDSLGNGYLDKTQILSGSGTPTSLSVYLFKRHQTDNDSITLCSGKIYKCSMKNKTTGEVVLDLVPAKDTSNVICMFDLISRKYFYNSGTGVFTGV